MPDLSKLKLENLIIKEASVSNIDGLLNCKTIKTLDLNTNKIQNLDGIKNMSLLTKLDISNNNIYNTYNDDVNNKKINNLQILTDLHTKQLTTLNISGNNLEDSHELDELKQLFGSGGTF